MRSQKWDRQAVPFLGLTLGSFFEVFCIRVAEAQSFGFNETLWLIATGRATREALLSEAGFEKVFPDPELGLNPLEVSFLLFRCVWWLDCLPLKEGPSAFCSP